MTAVGVTTMDGGRAERSLEGSAHAVCAKDTLAPEFMADFFSRNLSASPPTYTFLIYSVYSTTSFCDQYK
jgi:hypothetical protein